jgi:hypothetical protein
MRFSVPGNESPLAARFARRNRCVTNHKARGRQSRLSASIPQAMVTLAADYNSTDGIDFPDTSSSGTLKIIWL